MTNQRPQIPQPDFRDLVGRLDFGRTTGNDVTFSPEEAWILREHIRALALLADPEENAKIKNLLMGGDRA